MVACAAHCGHPERGWVMDPIVDQSVENDDDKHERKRQKRDLLATHKDKAKALKYAKAFPGEGLEERNEQLFCTFCNRQVPFDKKSAVRQHCAGQRKKAGLKGGTVSKHQTNKAVARVAAEKKDALQQAIDRQRTLMLQKAREDASRQAGATLPLQMQADRVEVLETLWEAGVPLQTLRSERFVQLIERPHLALGSVEGVRAVMPLVQARALEAVKAAIKGRRIAVFVDGTKANFLVEGVIGRYVDDGHHVQQVCLGVAAITKSLNTDSLMALLRKHVVDAGIQFADVIGVMSDCGQPNPAAMTKWNEIARETGQREEEFLWLPCLMHAASNIGLTLRKQLGNVKVRCVEHWFSRSSSLLTDVKLFMSGFKKMSNESEAARQLWLEKTGKSCKQLSDKSFWRWWQCIRAILKVREHLPAFLREATLRKLSKKSIAKMEEARKNPLLFAQMQFCIAAGQIFRDMGVMLEGDGFCLPFVHKHISAAQDFYAMWPRVGRAEAAQHHMIAPIYTELRESRRNDALVEALPFTLYDVGSAVAVHADSAVLQGMSSLLPLYRAGSLLHPLRFLAETERPRFKEYLAAAIDVLTALKGVKGEVLQLKIDLNAQIISYQQACREHARHLQAAPKEDTPPLLWTWWVSISAVVPAWFSIAQILVLLQPTSAAIERFFSLVKANTSPLQNKESTATFVARCMTIYNHPPQ